VRYVAAKTPNEKEKLKSEKELLNQKLMQKFSLLRPHFSFKKDWNGTFGEAVTVFTDEINDFIFSVETHVEQLRQNGNLNNDEQIAYAAVYKLKEKCGKSIIKFNNEFMKIASKKAGIEILDVFFYYSYRH
jgi:hypothetical protein